MQALLVPPRRAHGPARLRTPDRPWPQVEKDSEKVLRLLVEEEMTKARVRCCPKCNVPFVKESGCNMVREAAYLAGFRVHDPPPLSSPRR